MPNLTESIPTLLLQFDSRLRQEAERLVDDDAVKGIDLLEDEMMAEVKLDKQGANVRWLQTPRGWLGECDVGDKALDDLALCASLVAVQRREARGTLPVPHAAEEDFEDFIAEKLGRPLTPDEENYLAKVEKRYERVTLTGKIFDQDMVRLQAKWQIKSTEPITLWPEQPKTLRQFWNFIAVALADKGLVVPAFLRGIADVEGTRDSLKDWRHESTVPQWRARIRQFNESRIAKMPPRIRSLEFRLMVNVYEARLQMRDLGKEESEFANVHPLEVDRYGKQLREGLISTSAASELLLHACMSQSEGGAAGPFRLEGEAHGAWLAGLFQKVAMQELILTRDEVPFDRIEESLLWASRESDDGRQLLLRLVTAAGEAAPLPLRILRGVDTLYLSADNVFNGPPWLGDESLIENEITMPIDAIASPEGITFLSGLEVPVPPGIASRVKHEALRVKITAACKARSPSGGGTEYATFKLEAIGSDGRAREVLTPRGWSPLVRDVEDGEEIIVRDRDALRTAERIVQEGRFAWDFESSSFRHRMAKDFPEWFHQWGTNLPENIDLDADEQLVTILSDPLIARVRLEAKQGGDIDWLDLRIVFDIEGADLKPADIRRLLAAKGEHVRLADGSWRRVKLELSDEQIAMLDSLGIDLEAEGSDTHRLHWRQLAQEKAVEVVNPKAWEKIVQRMEEAKLDSNPPVPPELTVTLRPYQVEGYQFLTYLTLNRFGGILADDMGLGKTLQAIAWVLWLKGRKPEGGPHLPILVVCPKSVLDVWALEFKKGAPHLRVLVLHDRDLFDIKTVQEQIDVLVLNYAQLRSFGEELALIRFLACILDEGQHIKNPDSQTARSARGLRADNRLVLSGTPLENRLLDLWSLMTFATPGALGDRNYFHRNFDRRKDTKASERLAARLRPFLLRRTKSQVARDLPSRTEETLISEMSGRQAELYKEELARAQMLVLSSSGFDMVNKRRFALLQALTRLRQICCHPSLVDKTAENEESAKLTATLERIEELHAEGHKVLLFSQFVSMLKIIRTKLEEMKLPFHWLTGASTDRASIVKAFQEDENASVFLLSLKAGGSGLNLTAASYVILYDPWWNPAVENQAIDRAHRIGQTQPVIAYRMLTRSTIEEKIMTLQQKKNLMISNVLGEGGFTNLLQKEDFEFLFDIEAARV